MRYRGSRDHIDLLGKEVGNSKHGVGLLGRDVNFMNLLHLGSKWQN